MANDFAKIKTTAFQRWDQRLGAVRDSWMEAADFVYADASALQRSAMFGTTHFAAQSAGSDPAAQDLDSVKNTVSSVAYEKLHTVTLKDLRDNPEIYVEITDKLFDAAMSTISNLWWTALTAVATTAHPGDQAPYLGGGGGAAFYADTFTAPNAQGNLLTGAFSASNLATAKATLGKYLNSAGLPAGVSVANSNLVICCGYDIEKSVYDVVNGMNEGGGSTESGYSRGITVAVDPGYQMDANDWVLIAKSHKPIKMWMRSAPQLLVERDLGHIDFYAEFEAAAFLEPDETGFIYSAVA